jgi:hypothetical protein
VLLHSRNFVRDGSLQEDGEADPSALNRFRCERVARHLVDNRPVGEIDVNRSSRFVRAERYAEKEKRRSLAPPF